MYFPDDMNFQYFFFDTYIGYFLQALPIALIVSIIYGLIRFRKDKTTTFKTKVFSCIFVCYITGLICLVLGLDLMNIIWFNGDFDFTIDFINNISGETVGNFLMFLPFGILYPLSQKEITWKKVIIVGIVLVFVIEVFQPVFGRAFDLNDVILNSLGIVISTVIFTIVKNMVKKTKLEV